MCDELGISRFETIPEVLDAIGERRVGPAEPSKVRESNARLEGVVQELHRMFAG